MKARDVLVERFTERLAQLTHRELFDDLGHAKTAGARQAAELILAELGRRGWRADSSSREPGFPEL